MTNLVAIISSAFAVFLLIGMNAGELGEQMEKSREGELLAKRLTQGRARRIFTHSGSVGWRIFVLVILLGAIAIPLKNAFVQLTEEAAARSTVQQVVKGLLPSGALVSQKVDVDEIILPSIYSQHRKCLRRNGAKRGKRSKNVPAGRRSCRQSGQRKHRSIALILP